ncbi:OadG family protein [Treponema berlinense]|uniref:OadG family protein n=1 Tax=Treponema berlinense TaxID=225004 RepID=UPI0026EAD812|nr:OadG family protein [Treponema berlinense]
MTIQEMLGQSAILTVLGMCVVFAFLIILIGFMNLLRVFVHVAKLDKEAPKSESAAPAPAQADQKAVVAAIAAALHNKN